MKPRLATMSVTFIGLHFPLVALAAASVLMDWNDAGLILGVAFMSTVVAVAVTLGLLHYVLLPREISGTPA